MATGMGTAIGAFIIVVTILEIISLLNFESLLRLFGASSQAVLALVKSYMLVEISFQIINFP